jgi:hypothetical protein
MNNMKVSSEPGSDLSTFIMRKIFLFLALPLFLSRADEPAASPAEPATWTIQIECRMVDLPQKAALPLIAKSTNGTSGSEIWNEVERLLESDEAVLRAEIFMPISASGYSSSETVTEVSYPTDFDSFPLPAQLPKEQVEEALKAWPVKGSFPTSISMRKIGESLEIDEGVSSDGLWIDVKLHALHTHLVKWQTFDYGELPTGERLSVKQPYFEKELDDGEFRCKNGESLLLGVHKLAGQEKTFELCLIRVTAKKTGPPGPPKTDPPLAL